MTDTRNRTYIEYPMDFSNPNSENMRHILDSVGLVGNTVAQRQRNQRLRSTLVARGLLFAMMRPTFYERSPAYAYLHPAYTQAALQDGPNLSDYSRSNSWLENIIPHLQTFALKDEARELISTGIATHYNRIANQTLKLPHSSTEVWIPAYENTSGVDPMGIMGATARRVTLSSQDIYKDRSDHKRTYYRIMTIASHIGWAVPGIETEETRADILNAFSASLNPERTVDSQALFMAGTTIAETEIPLTEVFGLQNQ